MVKDLGMGVDIMEKEDEENDDDAVYPKVGNVGSSFLECFNSVGRNGEWLELDHLPPWPVCAKA